MADLSNLPDPQRYEIGRGTSDSPQIQLYTGKPCLGVTAPTTGITFLFIVSKGLLIVSAANIPPATDPNVLLYFTSASGVVTVDEEAGQAQVNIPALATSNPNDATVAAKFDNDQPYPFVLIATNVIGDVRVLARGSFIVKAVA